MFKSSRFNSKQLNSFSAPYDDGRKGPTEVIDLTDGGNVSTGSYNSNVVNGNDSATNILNSCSASGGSMLSLPGQADFASQRAMAIRRKKEKDKHITSPFKKNKHLPPQQQESLSPAHRAHLTESPADYNFSSKKVPSSAFYNGKHNGFIRSSALLSPTKLAIYRTQGTNSKDSPEQKHEHKSGHARPKHKKVRLRMDLDGWPSSSDTSDEGSSPKINKKFRSEKDSTTQFFSNESDCGTSRSISGHISPKYNGDQTYRSEEWRSPDLLQGFDSCRNSAVSMSFRPTTNNSFSVSSPYLEGISTREVSVENGISQDQSQNLSSSFMDCEFLELPSRRRNYQEESSAGLAAVPNTSGRPSIANSGKSL